MSALRILDPLRLKDLLQRYDCSQSKAAQLIDVNPRTMRRWCAGDSRMPEEKLYYLQHRLEDRKRVLAMWEKPAGLPPHT